LPLQTLNYYAPVMQTDARVCIKLMRLVFGCKYCKAQVVWLLWKNHTL